MSLGFWVEGMGLQPVGLRGDFAIEGRLEEGVFDEQVAGSEGVVEFSLEIGAAGENLGEEAKRDADFGAEVGGVFSEGEAVQKSFALFGRESGESGHGRLRWGEWSAVFLPLLERLRENGVFWGEKRGLAKARRRKGKRGRGIKLLGGMGFFWGVVACRTEQRNRSLRSE